MREETKLCATEIVLQKIESASTLYNRLVLIVGKNTTGKSRLLFSVAEELDIPCVCVGAELSRRLLEIAPGQRALHLPRLLNEVLQLEASVAILDNIEVLFDKNLQNDPLKLLQNLSRNTTILAAWSGFMHFDALIYATLGHPEYRCYHSPELLIFDLNTYSPSAC